jgi:hypothetical protein
METLKDIWVNDHLGKLEFRVDRVPVDGAVIHRVVIASMTMGGEPVYVSPSMFEDDAMELYNVLVSLYDKE